MVGTVPASPPPRDLEGPVSHPPIHVAAYGESGAGKSTFARSFPKPMLVLHFDPHGKDPPYPAQGPVLDLVLEGGVWTRAVMSTKHPDVPLIRLEYYHD